MILSGMITWWKEQMRDLVPASLRSAPGHRWRPEPMAAAEALRVVDQNDTGSQLSLVFASDAEQRLMEDAIASVIARQAA